MSPRFRSKVVVLVVVGFLLLAGVPGLAAADSRVGGSVVVPEGRTVDGLEVVGGSVVVRGTVSGDLTGAAGDVTVAETGRVTGNVEVAAGNLRIAGTVGGNVAAGAGSVAVAPTADIGGDLDAGAGAVTIAGRVAGDVTVGAETVTLAPGARVGGDLTYDGRLRGDRAAVAGQVERDSSLGPGPFSAPVGPAVPQVLGVYGFLVNLALGAALLLVFPAASRRVADRAVGAPLRTGGAGLLALIGVPVALVLVALTLVGIPLALVGALLFVVLLWVGAVYGRIAVGTWLLGYTGTDSRWAALLVGMLAVAVGVRLPVVGGLVDLLVLLLGLGSLAVVAVDARRGRRATGEGTPAGTDEAAAGSDGVPPA